MKAPHVEVPYKMKAPHVEVPYKMKAPHVEVPYKMKAPHVEVPYKMKAPHPFKMLVSVNPATKASITEDQNFQHTSHFIKSQQSAR